jgi:Phage protein D
MTLPADHPRPIFSIRIKSGSSLRDITGTFANRLESLTITENRGVEADQLDVTLLDLDGQIDIPQRGIELQVGIGWKETGLIDKGTFIVDEVEHSGSPDKLTIRARSADLRAGLTTQKERSWHDTTLGAIARSVAATHALTPTIAPELASKPLAHVDQTNESDINLLTRLAGMFDAILTVKHGKLLLMPSGQGLSASGKPLGRAKITRASGDQHRFSVADRDTWTAVRALYNDVRNATKGEVVVNDVSPATAQESSTVTATGRVFHIGKIYNSKSAATRAAREKYRALLKGKQQYGTVTAGWKNPETGKITQVIITTENLNASKGPDALASNAAEPADVLTASADNIKTLRHVYANKANANAAARAELARIKRGTSTFGLTLAHGRPDIFPELPVTVQGWKPSIDSTDWIVVRATHTLTDAAGLISRLEMELKTSEP